MVGPLKYAPTTHPQSDEIRQDAQVPIPTELIHEPGLSSRKCHSPFGPFLLHPRKRGSVEV